MSENIGVVSYDPMPNMGTGFLESAKRALFKFFGVDVQAASSNNTQQASDDQSPTQDITPSASTGGVVIVERSIGSGGGSQYN